VKMAWLLNKLRARLAAWDAALLRMARLFALYRLAAARGLKVEDAGNWMFYAHSPKFAGHRLPPNGTCTAEDLKTLIEGKPLEIW